MMIIMILSSSQQHNNTNIEKQQKNDNLFIQSIFSFFEDVVKFLGLGEIIWYEWQ